MRTLQRTKAIIPMLFVVLLAACATQKPAEQPKNEAPVATPASSPAAIPRTVAQPVIPANPLHDPANILSKRSVYFAFDKYEVTAQYQPIVEAHAKYMKDYPGATIAVQGNCDERGSREYNLALGQRRADVVSKMMILLGLPATRIEAVSFGEEKPKATGHDEAAWAENRRSDIVYVKER